MTGTARAAGACFLPRSRQADALRRTSPVVYTVCSTPPNVRLKRVPSMLIHLLLVLAPLAFAADAADLVLVRDGASAYRIVIPDDALPVESYAARELQSLLQEMSGVALPIEDEATRGAGPAIFIGATQRLASLPQARRVPPGPDGVHILADGDDLILTGEGLRGRLYSVYVLLEKYLGVRFLAHDCTVVPKRETVAVPRMDFTHTPPMMYRETLYWDSFGKKIAARQRLNGPFSQADEETGGKVVIHPYVHSFCELVPPAEFYDEHPEYFSLVGGQRTRETIHGQLCLTNPDVLRIATQRVLQWMQERPEVPIFDVSQNDGNGACECDACSKVAAEEGSQHGPILRFVNAIADVVKEKYPDRWVETLAYAYSTTPPKLTRPRDNVIIRLCHGGCYYHGLEACDLGSGLVGVLKRWGELTDRIFIWHYATNFAHYLAPNPNLEGLAKDIRFYASNHVNGLMVQADYQSPGGELAELRQYLAARLMWDPEQDPLALRKEFCDGYYGPAAERVQEFLMLMDDLGRDPDRHSFGAWDPSGVIPPEFVSRGVGILTRAQADAGTPEFANRVTRLILPLWYMQLTWPGKYGLANERVAEVIAEAAAVIERDAITHVCEGGENASGWLRNLQARQEAPPEGMVADLLAAMADAQVTNCLDWRTETIEEDGRPRACIFQHPAAEGDGDATYSLELPALAAGQRLRLRFATGFTGPTENGVRFSVLVDGRYVFESEQTTLSPVRHEVDLSAWAGHTVPLTLRVNALENSVHDWSVWVRPVIVRE